jgi:hypothetical protein
MAIFDGRHAFFPVPTPLVVQRTGQRKGIAFHDGHEEEVIEEFKGGQSLDLSLLEWRVYAVIAARCSGRGHSSFINNRFLEHFTGIGPKELRETITKLETERKLFYSEPSANRRGRRYWLVDEDGGSYDGAPVYTSAGKLWRNNHRTPVNDSEDAGTSGRAESLIPNLTILFLLCLSVLIFHSC